MTKIVDRCHHAVTADQAYAGELIAWLWSLLPWWQVRLGIVKRPEGTTGFQRLPTRWSVARTFGWLGRYGRLTWTSEATIRVAMLHFGTLPLTFVDPDDWAKIEPGDVLRLPDAREAIRHANQLQVINQTKHATYVTEHAMTARQVGMILAGSLITLFRARHATHTQAP